MVDQRPTRARRLATWARRYLTPPAGVAVRRLIALMTLAVGLPRLPGVADGVVFAPHRFGDPAVLGAVATATGLLLLTTAYHGRLSIIGRLSAALGFAVWITLSAATLSATSLLIDLAVALSLLVEAGTTRHE